MDKKAVLALEPEQIRKFIKTETPETVMIMLGKIGPDIRRIVFDAISLQHPAEARPDVNKNLLLEEAQQSIRDFADKISKWWVITFLIEFDPKRREILLNNLDIDQLRALAQEKLWEQAPAAVLRFHGKLLEQLQKAAGQILKGLGKSPPVSRGAFFYSSVSIDFK